MEMAEHYYQENGLTFHTKADLVEDDDWYEWRVDVDASPDQLQKIDKVEYILHSTFPDRVRVKKDPSDKFALVSEGWGEFDIVANVFFKDGGKKSAIVPLKFK